MKERQAFVEREKEYRRRALEALYDNWRALSPNAVTAMKHTEIAELLDVTPDVAIRVLEHLERVGLVESLAANRYLYAISSEGMHIIETPGQLDEVLPPPAVNIIAAGRDMHISGTVQQGVDVSSVRVEWSDVSRAIPQLRHAIEGVEDDRIREFVSAYLDDIEAQARNPNPDVSLARKALDSVWFAVQASAAAKTLYPLLQALAAALGGSLPPLPG